MIEVKARIHVDGITYTVPVRVERLELLPAQIADIRRKIRAGEWSKIVTGD